MRKHPRRIKQLNRRVASPWVVKQDRRGYIYATNGATEIALGETIRKAKTALEGGELVFIR